MRKKTVLVTGGARRVGRAITLMLLENGYDVIVHYNRSYDDCRSIIEQYPDSARAMGCDFLNDDIGRFFTSLGKVDAIVNCASVFGEDITFETYMKIHYRVPLMLTEMLYERAVADSERLDVINIVDSHVENPSARFRDYYLSKDALRSQSVMLSRMYRRNLNINMVMPGLVLSHGSDEEYFRRMENELPAGRRGTPEDVARCVLFLLENGYVSGTTLYPDGGMNL